MILAKNVNLVIKKSQTEIREPREKWWKQTGSRGHPKTTWI